MTRADRIARRVSVSACGLGIIVTLFHATTGSVAAVLLFCAFALLLLAVTSTHR